MARVKCNENALSDDMRILLDLVGPDVFARIVDDFGGGMIYIPKRENLEKVGCYEAIREEFNQGVSLTTLTDKYRYTERHIREIVFGSRKDKKGPERGPRRGVKV